MSDEIVPFDYARWSATPRWPVTEPYCYHRAKNSCVGAVDTMQIKTVYKNNVPREHVRGLCRHHSFLLRKKKAQYDG